MGRTHRLISAVDFIAKKPKHTGETMDTISKHSFVTLSYTATDSDGNVVDEGVEPLRYLHGGYEGIFLPIETALAGKTVGDSVTVKLQPADAFGEYNPELLDVV